MTELETRVITTAEVSEVFDAILAEYGPDYRRVDATPIARGSLEHIEQSVAGCAYSNADDTPSCIVGVLLDKFGLARPEFGTYENGVGITELPVSELFSEAALTWLERAQDAQDAGDTWAEAIEYARGADS